MRKMLLFVLLTMVASLPTVAADTPAESPDKETPAKKVKADNPEIGKAAAESKAVSETPAKPTRIAKIEKKTGGKKAAGKKKAGKRRVRGVNAEEAEVLTFAKTHHPELAELVEGLRTTNRRAFRRAVRQLANSMRRLERLKEKDEERYNEALAMWQLDSRIRLLAAKMVMADDEGLKQELRSLVAERIDLQSGQLKAERERLARRIEHMDQKIARFEEDREAAIDAELERLESNTQSKRQTVLRDGGDTKGADFKAAGESKKQRKKAAKAEVGDSAE